MKLLTASKYGLARSCQYPWTDGVEWSEARGDAAQRGNDIHKAIAHCLLSGASGFGRVSVAVEFARSALGYGERMLVEPAYYWSPADDDGRLLGEDIGRDYSGAPPGSVCGSADVAIVKLKEGRVLVIDWKSGHTHADFDTRHEDQMRLLALMAARAHGVSNVDVVVFHVDSGQQVVYPFDAFDLDGIASEVREVVASMAAATPKPGAHCEGCPARSSCPETRAAMELAQRWELTDVEALARVYPKLLVLERAVDDLKARARAIVEANGPVKLADGRTLRMVSTRRESINAKRALALAEKLGADGTELANCMSSAEVKSLRAVGKAET